MNKENMTFIDMPQGLTLVSGDQQIRGDFTRLLPRLAEANMRGEMLVKAAKLKTVGHAVPVVLDATAGLGEDSLLLAAAGYRVELYERDETIAALLEDALERAKQDSRLTETVSRMFLHKEDSIQAMQQIAKETHRPELQEDSAEIEKEKKQKEENQEAEEYEKEGAKEGAREEAEEIRIPDIIMLDPMFPARRKSALVKKKFQVLHQLEKPCDDEEELLEAALAVHPRKIIIKRPIKGPFLAGKKPSYSLKGKAIRYDCIVM